MKQRRVSWIIPLLGLWLTLPMGVHAGQKQAGNTCEKEVTEAEIPESGWSNGNFLGPHWWDKNPNKLKLVPQLWLYHLDLSYAYSEQTGNIDAKSHRGDVDLYLRKDLLTSITSYYIGNRKTVSKLTDKEITVQDEEFRQAFRYAFTDNMAAVLGFSSKKNSGKYIDQRTITYAGLRYLAINTPEYFLMFSAFYGPGSKTSYMSYKIREKKQYSNFPDVADYTSDMVYLAQRFDWIINDTTTFSQNLDYRKFLEDSEFYNLKLDFKLDFKFAKSTSFVVSYLIDYDNNSFVKFTKSYLDKRADAGKSSGDMKTTDTSFNVGIKFSF